MERADRRLVWTGIVLSLLVLLTALPIAQFYRAYWPRVTHIPALVLRRERQSGGQWTSLSEISPWLPKALIATEDRTFSTNIGISFEGIGRSLVVDLQTGHLTEGGSTLTQQLVRDMLLNPKKQFRRKVAEALLALAVTALYSKREILALYLNEVYLGNGAYGIAAASHQYFGVSPAALTLPEASLIAGLPQAPSAYDPLDHWSAAKERQWQVLQSMVADQMISPIEAGRVFRQPIPLRQNPSGPRA